MILIVYRLLFDWFDCVSIDVRFDFDVRLMFELSFSKKHRWLTQLLLIVPIREGYLLNVGHNDALHKVRKSEGRDSYIR